MSCSDKRYEDTISTIKAEFLEHMLNNKVNKNKLKRNRRNKRIKKKHEK